MPAIFALEGANRDRRNATEMRHRMNLPLTDRNPQMRRSWSLVVYLSVLLAACSPHGSSMAQPDGNIATLRATLSKLNLADPRADVKAHVAFGDVRPVGLFGYTCSVPGPDSNNPPTPTGIRCLRGTSDAIGSVEYGRLIETARNYAIAYNKALRKEQDGK